MIFQSDVRNTVPDAQDADQLIQIASPIRQGKGGVLIVKRNFVDRALDWARILSRFNDKDAGFSGIAKLLIVL